uniref:Sulfurtransferase n=1 Tax=Parastrongyloides trichosuri TaxID=131310 RepID=A0A0N4ZRK0_PARTI
MYYPGDRIWQNRGRNFCSTSSPQSISRNFFTKSVDQNNVNKQHTYNTVIDDKTGPTYEDPDSLYERNNIIGTDITNSQILPPIIQSPSPPPVPPANIESLQRLKRSMLNSSSLNQEMNEKGILIKDKEIKSETILSNYEKINFDEKDENIKIKYNVFISGSELLSFLNIKKKICIFEVSSDRVDWSKNDFRKEHIESAKLLYYGNLSHVGVPVHPLQFQRYIRGLGVDEDCYVILYDKGEIVWSTYAFWIFKLYGHEKVSILDGGMIEWKKLQEVSNKYHTESGISNFLQKLGNFKSKWNSDYIMTFDDLLANFDRKEYDIVDAQKSDLILGHIRTAQNIPIEDVYEWSSDKWRNITQLDEVFKKTGLLPSRPIAVYCSNSLRASLIWVALQRMNYTASIYFGSWPEWLIRAPDYLKIIPKTKTRK